MVAACQRKHVTFRFATDVTKEPGLLGRFDRIVVATGAAYLFSSGALAMGLLEHGAGHWPIVSRVMTSSKVRDWFYHRARKATADRFTRLAKPDQIVTVIGDAAKPGKSKEAIASAFEAALLGK
jgi:hypothetical protein